MRKTVHYLHHGHPACAKPGPPKKWKAGHVWSADWIDVNCPSCLMKVMKVAKVKVAKAKAKRRGPKIRKLTLDEVVTAAVAAGATVSVGLVPIGSGDAPVARVPERPKLNWPMRQWPGDVYTRAMIAAMDYTDRDVTKVFKDNPTALWIITPYEVIERKEFFKPKPAAPALEVKPEATTTPNPK